MRIRKWLAVILALAVMGSCLPALSETAGDSRVADYLKQVAETQKDPWVLAILQAGASNIRWEGNTAVFQMRSFDPDLKSLGAYQKAEDRKAWRERAAENLKAYSLEVRMTFGEDGTPDKKQGAALLKQIKNAAGAAKGALGKPDWKNALTDLLFCFPVHGNSAGAVERTKAMIRDYNATSKKPYYVELSIGATSFVCSPEADVSALLRKADDCLYEAKQKRRETSIRY